MSLFMGAGGSKKVRLFIVVVVVTINEGEKAFHSGLMKAVKEAIGSDIGSKR